MTVDSGGPRLASPTMPALQLDSPSITSHTQQQHRSAAQPSFRLRSTRILLLLGLAITAFTLYQCVNVQMMEAALLTVQADPYGTLHIFMTFYVVSVVFFFPCMILQASGVPQCASSVVSGAVYGFGMGLVISWVATTFAQCFAFLLGRYLFRASVKSYMLSTFPNFAAMDAAMRKEGWKLIALLRLSPVLPYNVLNYAAALTPISFFSYSLSSAVAIIPWTVLYVYLGTLSSGVMDLARGKFPSAAAHTSSHMQKASSAISMVVMVATTVYGYVLSRRAISRVLKDADDLSKESTSSRDQPLQVVLGS